MSVFMDQMGVLFMDQIGASANVSDAADQQPNTLLDT